MKNKELLLKAIDNYALYTRCQRTLLKTLVDINVDSIATASVGELSKLTRITKPLIYNSLTLFEKEEVIEKIQGPNRGIGIFKLKHAKLEEIEKIYCTKYNLSRIK